MSAGTSRCQLGTTHALAGRDASWLGTIVVALYLVTTAGCAPFRPGLPSEPVAREQPAGAGPQILACARAQLGVPYRYGGSEPVRGFDCSGLVAWVHARQGIVVPRTAAAQFATAHKVEADELLPGDLVFFRLVPRSREITHVGIYAGQRRFIHAPQTGRDVSEANLDDRYYRERYAGAGRFYEPGAGAGPRLGHPSR